MWAMKSGDRQAASVPQNRVFAATRWSIVISAGLESSPYRKQALESLCETYWYPLYAYVRRRVPDVVASRMRKRYREELREEISQTVAGPDEVDDEIRNLFTVLEL